MFGYSEADIANGGLTGLRQKVVRKGMQSVCEALEVGEPTLADIITELEKPGAISARALTRPYCGRTSCRWRISDRT